MPPVATFLYAAQKSDDCARKRAPTRSAPPAHSGVAKQAFTRYGANASLDDIATEAAVGAGTLYRHFPTEMH